MYNKQNRNNDTNTNNVTRKIQHDSNNSKINSGTITAREKQSDGRPYKIVIILDDENA
jgi:hypothetical protein